MLLIFTFLFTFHSRTQVAYKSPTSCLPVAQRPSTDKSVFSDELSADFLTDLHDDGNNHVEIRQDRNLGLEEFRIP